MNIRLPALQHEALSFARKLEIAIVNSGFGATRATRVVGGAIPRGRVRKL